MKYKCNHCGKEIKSYKETRKVCSRCKGNWRKPSLWENILVKYGFRSPRKPYRPHIKSEPYQSLSDVVKPAEFGEARRMTNKELEEYDREVMEQGNLP